MSIDALFQALGSEIVGLGVKFVDQYIPADPSDEPEKFEYDVKAYSLLSHAAFEDFVESVSEALVAKIVKDILSMKVSISTACLLMTYRQTIEIEKLETEDQPTCFNFVRNALDEAKKQHSLVLMNNHGFSVSYLRSILTPVGINIHSSPKLESIRRLADARGSFAHTVAKKAMYGEYKKPQAHKVFTPEDAKVTVLDCLDICEKVKQDAAIILAA